MPRISQERREGRRKQVLEAAWRCFSRTGLHATTMLDIIRESGLSAGAVYLYFPSKEEIILTAIQTSLGGVRTMVHEILQEDDYESLPHLAAQLAAAVDRFAARDGYDLRSLALHGWSEAQTNAHVREAMVPMYREFLSMLAAAVGRARKRGIIEKNVRPNAAAGSLLSLLLGNIVQSALLDNHPTRGLANGLRGLMDSKPRKQGKRARKSS